MAYYLIMNKFAYFAMSVPLCFLFSELLRLKLHILYWFHYF